MTHPAVFLDRDGTLIEQVHHLTCPEEVRLIAGAAQSVARLQAAGYAVVVVTNQSVIGRGMLDEQGLAKVHAEMNRQLAEQGAAVDGIYFCPIAPRIKDPTRVEHPDRKPGPGMLLQAAQELDLQLDRSWMVGDAVSDVLAGRNAHVRGTIGVRTGYGERFDPQDPALDYLTDDINSAVGIILENWKK